MHRFQIINELVDAEFLEVEKYLNKEMKKEELKRLLLKDIQSTIEKVKTVDIASYLSNRDQEYLLEENREPKKPVINFSDFKVSDAQVMKYYQKVVQSAFEITYPDRNTIMSELLNVIPNIQKMYKYTIYKFDFKSFFYNITLNKLVSEIEKSRLLRPSEITFLRSYILSYNKYKNANLREIPLNCLRPGVGLNNALVEIVGERFDRYLRSELAEKELIYYARYVDDGILVFQESIEEREIKQIVEKVMKKCFGKKIRLNEEKTEIITGNNGDFEYLGYQFSIKENSFIFGIAESKLEKYENQLQRIVDEYGIQRRTDLLLLRLDFFYKRIVFYSMGNTSNYAKWKVRGISDSYRELKRYFSKKNIHNHISRKTLDLFGETLIRIFYEREIPLPVELKSQIKNGKFVNNFRKNKTVLLDKHIGYSYETLRGKVEILYGNSMNNFIEKQLPQMKSTYFQELIGDNQMFNRYGSTINRRVRNIEELSYKELTWYLLAEVYR